LDQPWWGSRDTLALSISEAAAVCGVRRRTIRRRQQAGEFEHAYKDADGSWRIPVNDLIAAGLRPNVVADPDEPRIVFTAASQVDRLRTEVAVLRERVRALEIIAREREERVTDLRTILRMLPASTEAEGPPLPQVEEPAPPAFDTEEEPAVEEVSQEPIPEEVQEAMTPSEPLAAKETPPPVRVTSPFDAPVSAAASTEPIVILPDVLSREPESEPFEGALDRSAELLETARQRSTELLEDAMSMWWPSPPARAQPEAAPSSRERSGPADVTPSRSDPAEAFTAVSDRAAAGTTLTEKPAGTPSSDQAPPAPPPPPSAPKESDLFMHDPIDEASFDWLDPDFGRPPRHLRRRLGRFFRRHRRPQ
jgi:hypothetical protein